MVVASVAGRPTTEVPARPRISTEAELAEVRQSATVLNQGGSDPAAEGSAEDR